VPLAEGKILIDAKWQPEISLQGLQGFSYVWVIFLFHKNTNQRFHAKVHPPRLGGDSMGVFATRSPHRPNPIGLSLLKLESVQSDHLVVSGLDLIEGTPILDIKPYLSEVEGPLKTQPANSTSINYKMEFANATSESEVGVNMQSRLDINLADRTSVEGWVQSTEPRKIWTFTWTTTAQTQLIDWQNQHHRSRLQELIEQVIGQDPRPIIYRGYEGQAEGPYRQSHVVRLHEADIYFRYLTEEAIEITSISIVKM
jgi:tRNA-Thr(GGU) m(6)t(6)A37 methyltransferase TsaA